MTDRAARIFTPSFLLLASCNFLGAMNFYLLTAVITEYSLTTYDLAYSTAALAVSMYVAGALLSRLALGRRIDGWGLKRVLVVGYVVLAATSCLYIVEPPFPVLVAVRFIQGLGFGVSSSASASGAALLVPAERRGEGIGYFSMTQAFATGVGPFVAIFLIGIAGYRALFVVAAAGAVLMALLGMIVQLPDVSPRAVSPAPATRASGGGATGDGAITRMLFRFVHPKVLPFGVSLLMAYVCYAGLITYLTLYASELGFSGAASLYFVIYAATILVSRPPMGRMADRHGENSVIRITFPSLVLGMAALGAAGTLHQPLLMIASGALVGFGIGSTQSVFQAIVARVVPAHELGLGNSTFLMMMDLGSGFAPVLLGLLVPAVGYAAMYYLLAVWAALAMAVYYLAHGRKVP